MLFVNSNKYESGVYDKKLTLWSVAIRIVLCTGFISKSWTTPLDNTTLIAGLLCCLTSHIWILPDRCPTITKFSSGIQESLVIASATPLSDILYSVGGCSGLQVWYTLINPSWQPVAILSVSYDFIIRALIYKLFQQFLIIDCQATFKIAECRTREKSTDLTTCLCLNSWSSLPVVAHHSLTVKSPLAVAAKVRVCASTLADQTAPLCPTNDPIQSPVSPFLTCGNLSICIWETGFGVILLLKK